MRFLKWHNHLVTAYFPATQLRVPVVTILLFGSNEALRVLHQIPTQIKIIQSVFIESLALENHDFYTVTRTTESDRTFLAHDGIEHRWLY